MVALNLLASAFHYAHNVLFFDAYPNEPAWLSPGRIDLLWFVITPLAVAGYLLWRRGYGVGARFLLGGYGLIGLGVLAHYWLAPPSAHTLAMNASILIEALMAAWLLVCLAVLRPPACAQRAEAA